MASSSGNKPLPEPMLTQICGVRYMATLARVKVTNQDRDGTETENYFYPSANHDRCTACPSVLREVSGHLNAWREWPEILYADVSWSSSELIRLWSRSVDFPPFGTTLTKMKRVKFGVSGHFPDNAWREWPEILYADVSWPLSELISLWSRSVEFYNFGTILT